ncbi:MAG TPA: aldehyde dehydrogenase family protein [Ktedonobacterales bacterium]|nr:aldehyde dehydrogenase family protein [Ktedonobacterales bacterium]
MMAVSLTVPQGMLIDGQWGPTRSGATFEDLDPATGETLAVVASAQAEDIDRAVQAAKRAFRQAPWARINPSERGRVLFKIGQLIRDHADELARVEAQDVGKLLVDAKNEILLCASLFEYYAGAADKILGEALQSGPDKWAYVLREPLGVVGAIVPWNYPLPLASLKVAPALAMGNAVVLKPAEEAPLTCLMLGQLALEAGVPAGLFNVIPGFGSVAGEALIHHRDVAMIAFTGSTEVGRKIMHAAADRIAHVELELGGKSPQIIFPDANLDAALQGVAVGLFKNAGQDCCAGSRVFVHQAIFTEVVDRLSAIARAQQVGNPLDPGTTMGPLISQRQCQRVHHYVETAVAQRAKVLEGGKPLFDGGEHHGNFYAPTVITEVTPEMTIFQEEVFGPVGILMPFHDEAEAIALANDTPYGLAAALWTQDLSTAHRVAHQIEAGMVWINEYYAHEMVLPFGGYKQSGVGKDYSMHALEAYSQLKEVAVRLL